MQGTLNLGIEKEIKVLVTSDWFTIANCKAYPKKLYIFGDNILRAGCAGQAQIRHEFNTSGLATKFYPGMGDGDFFSDDKYQKCVEIISTDIEKIKKRFNNEMYNFEVIVFPIAGLGTGLSQLPTKAPKVFKYLCDQLDIHFGVKTKPDGTLYV